VMLDRAVLWRKRHKNFEQSPPRLRHQRRHPCPNARPAIPTPAPPSTRWNVFTPSWAEKSLRKAGARQPGRPDAARRSRHQDAEPGLQPEPDRREVAEGQPVVQARYANIFV